MICCCKEKENYLFLASTVNRTRRNDSKLDQRRIRIDIGGKLHGGDN